ncbi:hypothetical protein EMCRGX_G027281 [Ephydatia muelleri]
MILLTSAYSYPETSIFVGVAMRKDEPPIIHRDLTASNILLTPDMRAKIADLGVSRMFELKEVLPALTLAPGTLAYMPPEALTERPNYDLKLDIFSFGVVALYTGNQKLPIAFEVTDIPKDVCERKELQLLKRRRWMEELGSAHPLYQLITKCLKDNPDSRPVTSDLCSDVEKLCHEYPWEFENILKSDVLDDMKQALEKENKGLLSRMCDMESEMRANKKDMQEKEEEIETILKDYTAVQRQLEDAKQEFETRLNESKHELIFMQSEKEQQQSLMQIEIDKERRKCKLLEMEMKKTKHECQQFLEHYLSKHDAETLELQKEKHKIEDHCHELKLEAEIFKADFEEERSAREILAGRLSEYEENGKPKTWWFKFSKDSS